jgi:hypothetical protein
MHPRLNSLRQIQALRGVRRFFSGAVNICQAVVPMGVTAHKITDMIRADDKHHKQVAPMTNGSKKVRYRLNKAPTSAIAHITSQAGFFQSAGPYL